MEGVRFGNAQSTGWRGCSFVSKGEYRVEEATAVDPDPV